MNSKSSLEIKETSSLLGDVLVRNVCFEFGP